MQGRTHYKYINKTNVLNFLYNNNLQQLYYRTAPTHKIKRGRVKDKVVFNAKAETISLTTRKVNIGIFQFP